MNSARRGGLYWRLATPRPTRRERFPSARASAPSCGHASARTGREGPARRGVGVRERGREQIGLPSTPPGGRLCAGAGIRNLHFHDLRREFASRLRESGASDHDVRDFLGHANITTTSRYLKSTSLRLERALADMEASVIRTPFAQTTESGLSADAQGRG